ncbi:hypothetical protein [Polynucleobacter necessarius]|uniref:hypothetical protein n=1 Tax=Polynucleobacter necessarius TaxID=576610 RepID=UPI001E376077|nr:hypothetical protein [Polynucleobacter necessarius]
MKLDRIEEFLPGITAYLSDPKQQAIFDAPKNPLKPKDFQKKLVCSKLVPHPQTRMLNLNRQIYCNGECMGKGQNAAAKQAWRALAKSKQLTANLQDLAESSIYTAYLSGWLVFEQ